MRITKKKNIKADKEQLAHDWPYKVTDIVSPWTSVASFWFPAPSRGVGLGFLYLTKCERSLLINNLTKVFSYENLDLMQVLN